MPSMTPSSHDPDDDFGVQDDWDADDDFGDNAEFDDAEDEAAEDDSDSQTAPCPNCGQPVYEEADYCPSCGSAVTPGAPAPGRRAWMIAGVLIVTLLAGALVYL